MRLAKLAPRDAVEIWGRLIGISFYDAAWGAEGGYAVARFLLDHSCFKAADHRVQPCFPGLAIHLPCERKTRYVYALPNIWPELRGSAPEHTEFLRKVGNEIGVTITFRPIPVEARRPGWNPKNQDEWAALVDAWYAVARGLLRDTGPCRELEPRIVVSFLAEAVGCPVDHAAGDWFMNDLRECSLRDLRESKRRILGAVRVAAGLARKIQDPWRLFIEAP